MNRKAFRRLDRVVPRILAAAVAVIFFLLCFDFWYASHPGAFVRMPVAFLSPSTYSTCSVHGTSPFFFNVVIDSKLKLIKKRNRCVI